MFKVAAEELYPDIGSLKIAQLFKD